MFLSNFAEKIYGQKLFTNTSFPANFPPTVYYLTPFLGTVPIDDSTTTFNEPVGFTRLGITNDTNNFEYFPSTNSVKNKSFLLFDFATYDWGTVQAIGAYDTPTGGNLIFYVPLKKKVSIDNGNAFLLLIGDLELSFD
jgi:hypothetical protein